MLVLLISRLIGLFLGGDGFGERSGEREGDLDGDRDGERLGLCDGEHEGLRVIHSLLRYGDF